MNQNELLIAIFGGVVGVVLIVGLICLMWRFIKRCKRDDELTPLNKQFFDEVQILDSNTLHWTQRV